MNWSNSAALIAITYGRPKLSDGRGSFDGPELPTAFGTVLGFRQFRLSPLGRLLPISNTGFVWKPGENIARCDIRGHTPAQRWCMCGFYAYHDPKYVLYTAGSAKVSAIVEAYGRVTIGAQGFRAEKARIKMLCTDHPLWRYRGIPRVEFIDLLDALKEQGRPY